MTFRENVQLKPFNSFHIAALAKYFSEVSSIDETQALTGEKKFRENAKLILGGGSNLLLTKDFDGIVVLNSILGMERVKEDEEHVWMKAMAGELWNNLVMHSIDLNLGGIENLSLIPGKVGAAPMQNIGAYGVELKDVFEELEAVEISSGRITKFSANDCEFGYRESVFKGKAKNQYIIVSVTLRLNKNAQPNISYGTLRETLEKMGVKELSIKSVSDTVIAIRKSKLPDPEIIGNAGSFFKNPEIPVGLFDQIKSENPSVPHYRAPEGKVKVPAAWLIEQCGWKGKIVGQTGAHRDQPLVLVNYGNASGQEILDLASKIQESVNQKFGILLNPEVNVI